MCGRLPECTLNICVSCRVVLKKCSGSQLVGEGMSCHQSDDLLPVPCELCCSVFFEACIAHLHHTRHGQL